jgi:hypothetical protein
MQAQTLRFAKVFMRDRRQLAARQTPAAGDFRFF